MEINESKISEAIYMPKSNNNNNDKKNTTLLENNSKKIKKNFKITENKNKYLIKLLLTFLVTCLILAILLCFSLTIFFNLKKKTEIGLKNDRDECKTRTCYKATNFILANLNQSVEPCINFQQFSCGNWLANNEEEKDQFTIAEEKMLLDFADVLNKPIDPNKDTNLTSNIKQFYQSCMNEYEIEVNSDKDFYNLMHKEFGPWPMVPNPLIDNLEQNIKYSNVTFFGFEQHLSRLSSLKFHFLFKFDSDDNYQKIFMGIVIPEDFCVLQKFFEQNFDSKNEFKKLMKNINKNMIESLKINKNIDEEDLDEQIEEMLMLANKLYYSTNSNQYRCGVPSGLPRSFHNITIKDLNKYLNQNTSSKPLLDFEFYLTHLNENLSKKLSGDTHIIISSLAFNYISDTLRGFKSLNFTTFKFQRAFSNLIYFHNLFSFIKPAKIYSFPHIHIVLPMKYYNLFFEYDRNIYNRTPSNNLELIYRFKREQICADSVKFAFTIINTNEEKELQLLYLKNKFNLNLKDETNKMFENLIQASFEVVNKQNWIDEITKNRIKIKVDQLIKNVVYSDAIFKNETNLDSKINSNYKLNSSFISNMLTLRRKSYFNDINYLDIELSQRIRNKNYVFAIFLSNMMYIKELNVLLVPAGVLIEPIYDSNNPIYLKYATVGTYILHEIYHLIHEEIKRSNYNQTLIDYNKRTECLKKNYESYVKTNYGYEINGYESLTEQISDNFGVLASYKAALKEIENKHGDYLPGIEYNKEQLFFIRYAQSYCRKRKHKKLSDFRGDYVIKNYRSFQVSLIPEFSDVFKCDYKNNKVNGYLDQCKIFD